MSGFEPAASAAAADERLGRFAVRLKPAPFPEFAVPGLGRFPIHINRDRYGVAAKLADQLQARGIETSVVETISSTARHIIYIGVSDERADSDQVYDISYAAFAAAKTVAAGMEQEGGLFWTVQNTGGDFGFSSQAGNQVGTAGLSALAKTAMKEWPKTSVKAIDVDLNASADQIADHICHELFRGGLEREVGFMADGSRLTVGLEPSDHKPFATTTLAPHDTLLVSGGARGVTAHALIALARKQPLRFILLGRTARVNAYPDTGTGSESEQELTKLLFERASAEGQALSPMDAKRLASEIVASREIGRTLEQLERLGSQACYVQADITDHQSLLDAITPITEQWGAIRGIVHGAGILADKRIADKQAELFRRVFLTKVAGFQAMLSVVNADDLKLVAIFSSVAAREGNIGQCDYAMANEVLNKMAHQLRNSRNHIVVKSLNWGPWEAGMVTPELKRHFVSQGIPLIPLTAGAALFAEEAGAMNRDEVEIVIGGGSVGAPSLFATREQIRTLEKVLDLQQDRWLDDHQIHDYRVIPIVAVHEWLTQFALSAYPDFAIIRMDRINVLKGIRIEPTRSSPIKLLATGTSRYDAERQQIEMDMWLADEEGTRHYTSRAIMGRPSPSGQADECLSPIEEAAHAPLPAWTMEPDHIYDRKLFHGPSFQVIDSLTACSAEYASGMLRVKAEQTSGQSTSSSLQPLSLLLDGGLQLARLWGYERYGKPSLPMSIGSAVVASWQTGDEPVRCELFVKRHNAQKFVLNIVWIDRHNQICAQLRQVEMYFIQERRT